MNCSYRMLKARTSVHSSRPSKTVRVSAIFGGFGGDKKNKQIVAPANESVTNLLSRDVKKIAVKDDLFEVMDKVTKDDALAPAASTSAPEPAAKAARRPAKAPEAEAPSGPSTTGDAIRAGLKAYAAGEYQASIDLFSKSLELPGNGVMRAVGSVREIACPSDAEEQSALYNMACAYSQLAQFDAALTCLRGALEAGLEQYATVKSDNDLAALRVAKGAEFNALVAEFESPIRKLKESLFSKEAVPSKKGLGRFTLPW